MSRTEIEERLARAAEIRRKLRKSTRKLMAFGAELLAARDRARASSGAGSR